MAIRWRGTFLEAAAALEPASLRASSMPPSRTARDRDDAFCTERHYADTLLERTEQLRSDLRQKAVEPPRSTVEEARQATSASHLDLPKMGRYDTMSTTASWEEGLGNGDDSEEEDEQAFIQGIGQMAQAILAGQDPKAVARAQRSRPSGAGSRGPALAAPCEEADAWQEDCTTMMICNLPCKVLQNQLKDVVDRELGLAGRYDYLFVPSSHRPNSNLGYAFINCKSVADAELCARLFTGYRFAGTSSAKACTVKPARIQGAERSLAQFSGSRRRRKARPFRATAAQPRRVGGSER